MYGVAKIAYHLDEVHIFLFLDDLLPLLRVVLPGTVDKRNVDCNLDPADIFNLQGRPHIQISPAKAGDKCLQRTPMHKLGAAFMRLKT